jgi:hypothetical protein
MDCGSFGSNASKFSGSIGAAAASPNAGLVAKFYQADGVIGDEAKQAADLIDAGRGSKNCTKSGN